MHVLLISPASDELQPVNASVTIDTVTDLEQAALLARSENDYQAVVADLRGAQNLEATIAQLGDFGVPAVALVHEIGPRVLRASLDAHVWVVESDWVDGEPDLIYRVVEYRVVGAMSMEEVAKLRERHVQMVHNEKFAAFGLLAAEVAHEINNPATFVITNLTVMIDYVATISRFHGELRQRLQAGAVVDVDVFAELEERHEIEFLGEDLNSLVRRSLTGLNRIHQIVQDLRYFGVDRQHQSEWIDLNALVRSAVNLVRPDARFRARIVVDVDDLPAIRTDAGRLSQVVLNLVVNAVQAIEGGAPADNEVRASAKVGDDVIVLSISDTGSGISEDDLAMVFEPFFTTKAPGEGSGLGLAISRDIMRALGGDIHVKSEVGVGSCFDVVIPRGDANE